MGNSYSNHITEYSQMDPIPMDELVRWADEHHDEISHIKNIFIIRCTAASSSLISSSALIWLIVRSRKGCSTIQHRLLIGLCIPDILSSVAYLLSNPMAPSDNKYFVWKAGGNEASCDAQGFLIALGTFGGLYYNAALSSYFLAVVKFDMSAIVHSCWYHDNISWFDL